MKFSRMAQFAAVTALALAMLPAGAIAQSSAPAPVAPAAPPVIVPAPVATSPSEPAAKPGETAAPVTATVQPLPVPTPVAPDPNPVMAWSLANAKALASVIEGIGKEGLTPADYQPAALRAAIAKGEGPDLDALASKSFTWLTEDLRDGRTPMKARVYLQESKHHNQTLNNHIKKMFTKILLI